MQLFKYTMSNFTPNPLTYVAVVNQIRALNQMLHSVVVMTNVFESNPNLNEVQPASFEKIIPMSLDEWKFEIAKNISDWVVIKDRLFSELPTYQKIKLEIKCFTGKEVQVTFVSLSGLYDVLVNILAEDSTAIVRFSEPNAEELVTYATCF